MFNFSNNDDATIAVYCRVSSEDQSDRGTIKNQVDYAENYCSLKGFKVYNFYLDDGVSGVIPFVNRPAAMNLLKDAMDNNLILLSFIN